jgi:hypothetical protein
MISLRLYAGVGRHRRVEDGTQRQRHRGRDRNCAFRLAPLAVLEERHEIGDGVGGTLAVGLTVGGMALTVGLARESLQSGRLR